MYKTHFEELFAHPENSPAWGTYLAAFMSADGTYPIFVSKVEKINNGKLLVHWDGYKWGYTETGDIMSYIWYSEEQMLRETSKRISNLAELNRLTQIRYNLSTPLDFGTLRLYEVAIDRIEAKYVVAFNEAHARSFFPQFTDEQIAWVSWIQMNTAQVLP